jgi:hypothetical protein
MGRAVREGSSPTRSGHPGIGRSHDSNGASSRETRPCRVEQFRALTFASGVTSPASERGFHLPNTERSDSTCVLVSLLRELARGHSAVRRTEQTSDCHLSSSGQSHGSAREARTVPCREVGNGAPVPTTFQRVVHEILHSRLRSPAWARGIARMEIRGTELEPCARAPPRLQHRLIHPKQQQGIC